MNRCRAAVFGKNRTVKVDTTQSRKLQQPWRQDFPIGDNNDKIRRQRTYQLPRFVGFQRRWLVDRKVQFVRALLNGRRMDRLAAPARFVRLRDDAGYLVALFE